MPHEAMDPRGSGVAAGLRDRMNFVAGLSVLCHSDHADELSAAGMDRSRGQAARANHF